MILHLLFTSIVLIHGAELIVMDRSKEFDLESGEKVSLDCLLSVPNGSQIRWLKVIETDQTQPIDEDYERFQITNNNTTLTLVDPKKASDEADYICLVTNPFGQTKNQTFKVRGKPEFTNFKAAKHIKDMNSFNVVEDEDLDLICEVILKSNFKEDKINFAWYRIFNNGSEEKITSGNITTKEEMDDRSNLIKKSILSMNEIKFDDHANYICEAANGGIKANNTVNVRVKDKLAALWPFLGIVAEVVILCTVICVYEKRKSKSEFEPEAR